MSSLIHLEVDEGEDTVFSYEYRDESTNLPIDVSGYHANLQVRKTIGNDTVEIEKSDTLGGISMGSTDGVVVVTFASADTIGKDWVSGFYDIFLTRISDNTKYRLARGKFTIQPRITS